LQVSKTLNKHVTHVVFKDGRSTTWRKAQKMGVKTVSVLWVEKCRETGVRVDESLFPAVGTNEGFPLLMKKHKCMQPKDFVEKTPENNRKLQRRLDQMAKNLALQKTAINAETDVPVLLFEENGSLIYSPVNKMKDQCNTRKRRIKDIRKKTLSPNGSQMTQIFSSSSPGDSPLSTCVLTNSEDVLLPGQQVEDCLNSSYDYLWGTEKLKRRKKEVVEHACDTWTDPLVSTSTSMNSPSCDNEQKSLTPKRCTRQSLTKKWIISHTLDDKLSLEKKQLKFPRKNQKNEKSKTASVANESSLHKGLGHIAPSEKLVQLNTSLIDSLSNSPMNSEDLNACSLDKSFPVDENGCILEDKKRKKLQPLPNWKLATSELGVSESKGLLQAVTTYSKCYCAEEASYEDFFSSSNLKENEVQIRIPKESQNPHEVCCKDSSTSMDFCNVSFCKPHNTTKKRRKKSISVKDVSVNKKFKPAKHPASMPLNILHSEKDGTAEVLDSDDVNR
ncbi:MCPH1 protein, partial [Serilophus lunatus]|nr:MCPH1 protein [Serilophus lunatus]